MKLQLPNSAHPDVVAGLSLLLALTGGMTWLIWRTTTSNVVPQVQAPTRIEQPTTAIPKVAPTVSSPAKVAPITQAPPATSVPAPVPRVPSVESPVTQPVFEPPAEVYWLQARGDQIEMVPVAVARTPQRSETAALTEAFNYLLTHPQMGNLSSTIPQGTRLLSLQIKPDGIRINLSQEFMEGGGSESMIYRVEQILYTATSLDPQAKVYLSVEGQLLDEDHPLGGEGLILQQPLTRQHSVRSLSSRD
jgi:spore germination protein GerM